MSLVIEEYQEYSLRPIETRMKLLNDINKFFSDGNNNSLEAMLTKIDGMMREIRKLESTHFNIDIKTDLETANKWYLTYLSLFIFFNI